MKAIIGGMRRLLIDGLLVVVPLGAVALLLTRIVNRLRTATDPLAGHYAHPVFAALVLFLLLCFLAGVLVRLAPGRWVRRQLERLLFERIPGYRLVRAFASDRLPGKGDQPPRPALVQIGEGRCPCLVMDHFADGQLLVFVPGSPAAMSGTLYIFTPERVQFLNVAPLPFLQSLAAWGLGLRELLEAAQREPSLRAAAAPPGVGRDQRPGSVEVTTDCATNTFPPTVAGCSSSADP